MTGDGSGCGLAWPATKSRSPRRLLMRCLDALPDAPQYPGRIDDHEISQAPWPIRRGIDHHAVLGRQPIVLNVAPPRLDVLDKKMHHEIIGVFLHIEVLQQEARMAVVKIREVVRRPSETEAQILV